MALLWFPPVGPIVSDKSEPWLWLSPSMAYGLLVAVALVCCVSAKTATKAWIAAALVLGTLAIRFVYSITLVH